MPRTKRERHRCRGLSKEARQNWRTSCASMGRRSEEADPVRMGTQAPLLEGASRREPGFPLPSPDLRAVRPKTEARFRGDRSRETFPTSLRLARISHKRGTFGDSASVAEVATTSPRPPRGLGAQRDAAGKPNRRPEFPQTSSPMNRDASTRCGQWPIRLPSVRNAGEPLVRATIGLQTSWKFQCFARLLVAVPSDECAHLVNGSLCPH